MAEAAPQKAWSTEWSRKIDPDKLDVFPLQFANCERIEHHDAVYLFDEVGCGKTVSAGLMTLHYLYNHPDKNVLVVTTNALVESGQFLRDWREKLPFGMLIEKVKRCNNLVSGIRSYKGNYGLLVIDEAHEFLNQEQERSKALKEIKAEKVIFLTATPVKDGGKSDLKIYKKIAEAIVEHPLPDDWIDELVPGEIENDPRRLICSRFDLHLPVTRYFKDTVRALTGEEMDKKAKARRLMADTWKYGCSESTSFGRLQKVASLYWNIWNIIIEGEERGKEKDKEEMKKSRFVVFIRLYKEAEEIYRFFTKPYSIEGRYEQRFWDFDQCVEDKPTIKVVMGYNKEELKQYSAKGGDKKLPTVLVVNYQIGESGVNLPGYNYVVNYYISAYPSRLEQRYGRIDRMNSDFPEINIRYLTTKSDYSDSNTKNFNSAVRIYIQELLTCLPSKNALLSVPIIKDLMEESKQGESEQKRRENRQRRLKEEAGSIEEINNEAGLREFLQWEKSGQPTPCQNKAWELLDQLLDKNKKWIDTDIPLFDEEKLKVYELPEAGNIAWVNLENAIKEALERQLKHEQNWLTDEQMELTKKIVEMGDKIFYSGDRDPLPITVEAIGDEKTGGCARWISESDAYKDFLEMFRWKYLPFPETGVSISRVPAGGDTDKFIDHGSPYQKVE